MTADHPISDCRIMSVTMLVLTVLLAAFVWCVKKSLSGSSCYIFLARRTKPWRPAYTLARVANTVCSCTAELIAVHLCAGLRGRSCAVRHIRNRLHFSFNTDREKHERRVGGLAVSPPAVSHRSTCIAFQAVLFVSPRELLINTAFNCVPSQFRSAPVTSGVVARLV